ncbi:MAG TPA: HisA/HisF-related TIM barrel protein [Actinomycetota bacterium]|nr:HisA/HisF-related TIM barrel protein [Actinomycetota bacterium]
MASSRFEVIPAIDVSGGRLARLHAGSVVTIEAFGGDPGQAAAAFVEAGARWLHVVDLDLAMTGESANLAVIERLSAFGARVQASGGIATLEAVDAALGAGAERVVLGSGVLAAGWLPSALTGPLADRLVLGLEVEGAAVRPRGRTDAEWPLDEILGRLAGAPPRRALVTAIANVGGMAGPDLEAIGSVAASLESPVLAAGGIATPEHVRAVAALGVEGAIVGRALYEGAGLGEFLDAVHEPPPGGV